MCLVLAFIVGMRSAVKWSARLSTKFLGTVHNSLSHEFWSSGMRSTPVVVGWLYSHTHTPHAPNQPSKRNCICSCSQLLHCSTLSELSRDSHASARTTASFQHNCTGMLSSTLETLITSFEYFERWISTRATSATIILLACDWLHSPWEKRGRQFQQSRVNTKTGSQSTDQRECKCSAFMWRNALLYRCITCVYTICLSIVLLYHCIHRFKRW